MPLNLDEISRRLNGQLKGDPAFVIESVNSVDRAGEKEISFLVRDEIDLESVRAGALLVKRDSPLRYPNLIYVDEPYAAFAQLLELFFPRQPFVRGIDDGAAVSDGARIGAHVGIGAFSYVGDRCVIGDHSEIHSGVIIYPDVHIGKHCLIYSNVVIRENVVIGDHVIIHPGAVIGADGFGLTRLSDGRPVKVPHKGKVIIGDHCEIGANTCIDRATIEETRLDAGVKLDNLVQVGHNVRIGGGTAISAQTGIAGSTVIGRNVVMGGQVGVADHIEIADGVMVAAQSGVTGTVKKKTILAGTPPQDIARWRRSSVIFRNLDSYVNHIKQLENKLKELEKITEEK